MDHQTLVQKTLQVLKQAFRKMIKTITNLVAKDFYCAARNRLDVELLLQIGPTKTAPLLISTIEIRVL